MTSLRDPSYVTVEAIVVGWNSSEEESDGQSAGLIKFILP